MVRSLRRRTRAAMTLIEVMVVIAILLAMAAVLLPAVADIGTLEQRRATRDLAFLYQRLRDEAVMQNVTFRITYRLNQGTYRVETGEPGGLIHSSREAREEWERQQAEKLAMMNEEERRSWAHARKPFEKISSSLDQDFRLPSGLVFGAVWTPAEGIPVTPDGRDGERRKGEDDGDPLTPDDQFQKVLSHVFADGSVEHTVLWLVDDDDAEVGWTVEVEPLSGHVEVTPEVVDFRKLEKRLPQRAPELPG